MLGLIVKVSTFDDIVGLSAHFPLDSNIQRITVLYSASR